MSWQGLEGHDAIAEQFRTALARGRLASTFLFVGPAGVGKRTFALRLVQSLLCEAPQARSALAPCGTCESCTLLVAGNHPDLAVVARPREKSFLPLELLIGPPDKRHQEGLCRHLSLKPFLGRGKMAILDDADDLNVEGANALLKTLEEPPPGSVLILVSANLDAQLPTIRSRSQVIRFAPLAVEVVARVLLTEGLVGDEAAARRLAERSGGSLERARQLSAAELGEFRPRVWQELAGPHLASVSLAREAVALIDNAGKEASLRRERARQVVELAVDFYRGLARALAGAPAGDDPEQTAAITRALAQGGYDLTTALAGVERSLEALDQIDRNVHLTTLVEAWLDDLAARRAAPVQAV